MQYQSQHNPPKKFNAQFLKKFDLYDQSFKDFSAPKRPKRTNKNKEGYEDEDNHYERKRQQRGMNMVRTDVIEQNLSVIVKKPARKDIFKSYTPRPRLYEDQSQKELKIIAYSLIKKGYGFNLYVDYVQQQNTSYLMVNRQKYKGYTIRIIQKVWKRLEIFLISECQKLVNKLRYEQMRYFSRYALRFNIYFQKIQAAAIVKFISSIYELQSVTITEFQAVHLYKAILELLKKILLGETIKPVWHQEERQNPQSTSNLWTPKYEKQLAQLYQLNQNIPKVYKCLCTIHQEFGTRISPEIIQSKIEEMLHETLKRLNFFHDKNKEKLPQLTDLTLNRMMFIIKSPTCIAIRSALLDFRQIGKHTDLQELANLIVQINQKFGIGSQNNKQQQKKMPSIKQVSKPKLHSQKVIKYVRATNQQQPQDWSKSILEVDRQEQSYKIRRFAETPKVIPFKSQKLNYFDDISDEYSDS